MKIFVVELKNGKRIEIEAMFYHRDDDQYVFIGADDAELKFVVASEVVSIVDHPKNPGRPGRGW